MTDTPLILEPSGIPVNLGLEPQSSDLVSLSFDARLKAMIEACLQDPSNSFFQDLIDADNVRDDAQDDAHMLQYTNKNW